MAKPRLGATTVPVTQAFGDAASAGTPGDNLALASHRHGMPASPGASHTQSHDHSASGDGQSLAPTALAFPAELTLAPATSQNNLAIGQISRLLLSPTAPIDLTGMVAPATDGRIVLIANDGSDITLKHESASSTALNRFWLPGNADFLIPGSGGVIVHYNVDRWSLIGVTSRVHDHGSATDGTALAPASMHIPSAQLNIDYAVGTGAVITFDGNSIASRVQMGMDSGGSDDSFRLYTSTLGNFLSFYLPDGRIYTRHHFPQAGGTYDIGESATRWREAYVQEIDASSEVRVASGNLVGVLTPGDLILSKYDASAQPTLSYYRALAAAAAVVSGSALGGFSFNGWSGSAWQEAASIYASVWGAPSGGTVPGMVEIRTSPGAGAGSTARWRVVSDGHIYPVDAGTPALDIGNSGARVRDAYVEDVDVSGVVRPSADSQVDVGTSSVRIRNVYSDQLLAAAPALGTSINSLSAVTLGTKTVEALAVGDQVFVDARVLILNNGGGVRNFTLDLNFSSAALLLTWQTSPLAAHASDRWWFHLMGTFTIISASAARAHGEIHQSVAASAAGGSAAIGTAQMLHMFGWQSSASDLTGARTVAITAKTSATGGTQTADLLAFRVERVRP